MKMTVKCSFNSTDEHASTTFTVFNNRAMIYHGFEVAVKVHHTTHALLFLHITILHGEAAGDLY